MERVQGKAVIKTKDRIEIRRETLDSIESIWRRVASPNIDWSCLFVTPPWLRTWWESFGAGRRMLLTTGWSEHRLLGFAPLMIEGPEARFMGAPDVCDYQDFVVASDQAPTFFRFLLEYLHRTGVSRLNLGALRPDSVTYRHFIPLLSELGYEAIISEEDVSYELELPASWDRYLERMKGKQRHEIRRKLRRLHEAGEIEYQVLEKRSEVMAAVPWFLEMFRASRSDKETFMTERMTGFFHRLFDRLAASGLLNLAFLRIDGARAAAVLCFDDGDTVYLYNNGYDPKYRSVAAGLLCKVLSIRDSIGRGRRRYDFLKGDEVYKQRLGAEPVPLYRCRLSLER